MTFPRHMSSGVTPPLPAVKVPVVTAQEPAEPSLPAMPAMKTPKMPKGVTVSVKKPKPPSSSMRIKNGM